MSIEEVKCTNCGSHKVVEYKKGMFVCKMCDAQFTDPRYTQSDVEVAPQFCEEGCGNPIKYRCTLCGKMVCEGHGEKAKVLLARKSFREKEWQEKLAQTTIPELQQSWCIGCSNEMSAEERAKYLTLALEDGYDDVREASAFALKNIGDPSVSDSLIELLSDRNYDVRVAVALALGTFRETAAIPHLARAYKEAKERNWFTTEWRLPLIRTMGDIGDPSAVPYLGEALEDGYDLVEDATVEALIKIGDSSAVQYLGEALRGKAEHKRRIAEAIREVGGPSTILFLGEALKDEDGDVAMGVASALGNIGDSSAVPYLVDALKSAGSEVSACIAHALGQIGDPSSIPYLGQALKDNNNYSGEDARYSIVEALWEIGGPSVIIYLKKALRDSEQRVRESAAAYLEDMGDPGGLAAVRRAKKLWAKGRGHEGSW